MTYAEIESTGAPIKAWTDGVPVEYEARRQLQNVAQLPFVHSHLAVMPDVHYGVGATVGSVIPTVGAIVPAAVGVDIGCGMSAVQTTLTASQLPDSLAGIRSLIESKVPVGRAMHVDPDNEARRTFRNELSSRLSVIVDKHPEVAAESGRVLAQLGTLGGGNHFVELCLDENDTVWVMLHSGSRNIGNRIGTHFIGLAKRDMERAQIQLPDRDLAYLTEGSEVFDDYVSAVEWAQDYARHNRRLMMQSVIFALGRESGLPPFTTTAQAVSCHHNYISREHHFGKDVWLTRKGAVSARAGELGIIPGCFAAVTRVLMANGLYRNIAEIRAGDRVVAGDGSSTVVTGVFAKGERTTWRYRNNAFHTWTEATPDHLHFIGDMSSSNIQTQGRLKIMERPNRDGTSKYRWARLDEMRPSVHSLLLPRDISFDDMPRSFRLEREGFCFEPSYSLGYVFGSFLGDGTCRYKSGDGGQVSWALGLHENAVAERIRAALESSLGVKSKSYPSGRCLLVVVHSAELARAMASFGKKTEKAVPEEFWCGHGDYVRGLTDGLFDTDGHLNSKTRKVTNTSTRLIEQYGVLHYLRDGYFPSVSVRAPSAGGLADCAPENCNPSYRSTSLRLPPLANHHQLVELLSVEHSDLTAEVFDIEVEHPDHSFIANNAIVHNSMGAKSFIVRGRGNPDSFCSCSHGAGRAMSRGEAKRRFTVADHEEATRGIECRKDESVIDETPAAYKDIDAVMAAQADLVDVVHTLRQVVCVKG